MSDIWTDPHGNRRYQAREALAWLSGTPALKCGYCGGGLRKEPTSPKTITSTITQPPPPGVHGPARAQTTTHTITVRPRAWCGKCRALYRCYTDAGGWNHSDSWLTVTEEEYQADDPWRNS